MRERALPAQSVSKMADRERVRLSRMVVHDYPKVIEHQKGRSLGPRRDHEVGTLARPWERLVANPVHAQALPFEQRMLARAIRHEIAKAGRQRHLVPPG